MRYGIVGYTGRMGEEAERVFGDASHELVLRVDERDEIAEGVPEVIVDFSRPEALPATIRLCREHGAALVLGTTALSEADKRAARELAEDVAVVYSENFGIGLNLLAMILEDYAEVLSGWEMEIAEVHHNRKKDAPSGTAKLLMASAGRVCPAHSLRLGNIPGDHAVFFCRDDELLTLSHRAINRAVFASGALVAAEFARTAPPGFRSFRDVLKSLRHNSGC